MAHFAQLDSSNVVTQVISVANEDILDDNNVEQESLGIAFCQNMFGSDTNWKQTSYNNNIRKNYAGIGYTYDSAKDAFIPPKPYPSWVLNDTTCIWECPLDMPSDAGTQDSEGNIIRYDWDDDAYQADNTTGWVLVGGS